jgi:hypothetical protein
VLLGEEIDKGIAHFEAKLPHVDDENGSSTEEEAFLPKDSSTAQILVRLLLRLGRVEAAVEVAAKHLVGLPEGMLACPSLPKLCQMAGRLDRLAQVSRAHGDLVHYTAAILAGSAADKKA